MVFLNVKCNDGEVYLTYISNSSYSGELITFSSYVSSRKNSHEKAWSYKGKQAAFRSLLEAE